jgi:hypothetical protein
MVDIESDGPIPTDYSMISFGAVVVEPSLNRTFYGKLRPISDKWIPEALAVSGHSRDETINFPEPKSTMIQFEQWIGSVATSRPRFISDNAGFDWSFINFYFHHFLGRNPFGFSSEDLGSLYKGLSSDMFTSFRHLVDTKHTHHPVDDARGHAEALLKMKSELGLKIKLK